MTSATQEDILREQILQAALQLYQKHGLNKVTMDDVAQLIGKTRTIIYYYFKDKDEIFEAAMDAQIHEMANEIEAVMDKAKSVQNKIRAFCKTKIKISEEKRAFFAAIETDMNADEMSNYAKLKYGIHQRLMKIETALLAKSLSAAVKNKEIRALKPKEQSSFIFIILSGVRGIKREAKLIGDANKLNAAIDTFVAMAAVWLAQ